MKERSRWIPGSMLIVIVLFVCFFGFWWWFGCGTPTTLLIVRHADRVDGQDLLTPDGVTRANELAHVGAKAGIVAIYHSDTVRARETAEPLGTALGITPLQRPGNDVAGLVAEIFAEHRGSTVFVVGHSDTVPQIIAAAGGPTIPQIANGEFDNLFVLTVWRFRHGMAKLVNLQYGTLSPPP